MGFRISIIIPTVGRREDLTRTLRALSRQDVGPESFEVVVVADGSRAAAAAAVAAADVPFALTLLDQPCRGAAAARGCGATAAAAPLLLFLDDDMEASPSLVSAHLAAHEAHPGGVVLGYFPLAEPGPDAAQDPYRVAVKLWWDRSFSARFDPACRYTFRDLCTGNVSMARSTYEAAGGFDARFGRHTAGEDYDLGWRLMKRGVRFRFVPAAASVHHDRPTGERALRRAEAEGRGDVILARKYPEIAHDLRLAELARRAGRPWFRPIWRLLWWWPGPGAVAALALRVPLALARACRMHGLMWRLHGCLQSFYYFRGVRTEAGSRAGWEAVAAAAARVPPAEREVTIDVATDLPRLDALLTAADADAARLHYRGEPLGRIWPMAGAEPLRADHVRHALIRDHSSVLLGLLALDRLTAADGQAVGGAGNGVVGVLAPQSSADAMRTEGRVDLDGEGANR